LSYCWCYYGYRNHHYHRCCENPTLHMNPSCFGKMLTKQAVPTITNMFEMNSNNILFVYETRNYLLPPAVLGELYTYIYICVCVCVCVCVFESGDLYTEMHLHLHVTFAKGALSVPLCVRYPQGQRKRWRNISHVLGPSIKLRFPL
jgi:hypothetical protein